MKSFSNEKHIADNFAKNQTPKMVIGIERPLSVGIREGKGQKTRIWEGNNLVKQ